MKNCSIHQPFVSWKGAMVKARQQIYTCKAAQKSKLGRWTQNSLCRVRLKIRYFPKIMTTLSLGTWWLSNGWNGVPQFQRNPYVFFNLRMFNTRPLATSMPWKLKVEKTMKIFVSSIYIYIYIRGSCCLFQRVRFYFHGSGIYCSLQGIDA